MEPKTAFVIAIVLAIIGLVVGGGIGYFVTNKYLCDKEEEKTDTATADIAVTDNTTGEETFLTVPVKKIRRKR